MQAFINEILQCIIHKPVARHAAFARKGGTGDTDPKMTAKALGVGTRVACMRGTFVDHFEAGWV